MRPYICHPALCPWRRVWPSCGGWGFPSAWTCWGSRDIWKVCCLSADACGPLSCAFCWTPSHKAEKRWKKQQMWLCCVVTLVIRVVSQFWSAALQQTLMRFIICCSSGYKNNRPTLILSFSEKTPLWVIFTVVKTHAIRNECTDIQLYIDTQTDPFFLLLSMFSSLPLCHAPSIRPPRPPTNRHTHARTHTHATKTESKRKRLRDRAWRRTGKGNSCAVLPLHSFLLGWSFPSGGERDCKLSKRTVRKQEAPSSSRESEMKSIWGPCSPGRLGEPLLERQFVQRYPSYRQGGSRCQNPLCYLVIVLGQKHDQNFRKFVFIFFY